MSEGPGAVGLEPGASAAGGAGLGLATGTASGASAARGSAARAAAGKAINPASTSAPHRRIVRMRGRSSRVRGRVSTAPPRRPAARVAGNAATATSVHEPRSAASVPCVAAFAAARRGRSEVTCTRRPPSSRTRRARAVRRDHRAARRGRPRSRCFVALANLTVDVGADRRPHHPYDPRRSRGLDVFLVVRLVREAIAEARGVDSLSVSPVAVVRISGSVTEPSYAEVVVLGGPCPRGGPPRTAQLVDPNPRNGALGPD